MAKRRYRCGGCNRLIDQTDMRRNRQGDVCCPHCQSQDVSLHLTGFQRFGAYLLVSNLY